MKYIGIHSNIYSSSNYNPIIYFYDELTYLAFNKENLLSFIIQNDEVPQKKAYNIEIENIIGIWVHIGLSSHVSNTVQKVYFPHMFLFHLLQWNYFH